MSEHPERGCVRQSCGRVALTLSAVMVGTVLRRPPPHQRHPPPVTTCPASPRPTGRSRARTSARASRAPPPRGPGHPGASRRRPGRSGRGAAARHRRGRRVRRGGAAVPQGGRPHGHGKGPVGRGQSGCHASRRSEEGRGPAGHRHRAPLRGHRQWRLGGAPFPVPPKAPWRPGYWGAATAERAGVNGVVFTLEAGGKKGDRPGAVGASWTTPPSPRRSAAAMRPGCPGRLPACALTTPARPSAARAKPVADGQRHRAADPDRLQVVPARAPARRSWRLSPPRRAAARATTRPPRCHRPRPGAPTSNTGDFAWSYDMPVPGARRPDPEVGLSYSSGSVDGRTANTNNQASWVGDGFDLSPGFIERRYKPCCRRRRARTPTATSRATCAGGTTTRPHLQRQGRRTRPRRRRTSSS